MFISRPSPILNLRTGGFEQFRKLVDISGARVANHEIAKPTLTPRRHVERQLFLHSSAIAPSTPQFAFWEYEDGNFVLPHRVEQVCARCLAEVGHTASQQGKLGVMDFGQIEGEGDLALEPGLYRVSI